MRVRDTYIYPARQRPMTVEAAISHSMSHPSEATRNAAVAATVGMLLTVLHRKGVLLPTELLEVLGDRYQDFDNDKTKA